MVKRPQFVRTYRATPESFAAPVVPPATVCISEVRTKYPSCGTVDVYSVQPIVLRANGFVRPLRFFADDLYLAHAFRLLSCQRAAARGFSARRSFILIYLTPDLSNCVGLRCAMPV